MRFCFTGNAVEHFENQALDADIHQAVWLSAEQIKARSAELRSPLVLDCLHDYLAGRRYPLNVLVEND